MQIKQLLVICAISYLLKKNTNYLGKSHRRKTLQKEAGNLDSGPLNKTHFPVMWPWESFQSLSYLFWN